MVYSETFVIIFETVLELPVVLFVKAPTPTKLSAVWSVDVLNLTVTSLSCVISIVNGWLGLLAFFTKVSKCAIGKTKNLYSAPLDAAGIFIEPSYGPIPKTWLDKVFSEMCASVKAFVSKL